MMEEKDKEILEKRGFLDPSNESPPEGVEIFARLNDGSYRWGKAEWDDPLGVWCLEENRDEHWITHFKVGENVTMGDTVLIV